MRHGCSDRKTVSPHCGLQMDRRFKCHACLPLRREICRCWNSLEPEGQPIDNVDVGGRGEGHFDGKRENLDPLSTSIVHACIEQLGHFILSFFFIKKVSPPLPPQRAISSFHFDVAEVLRNTHLCATISIGPSK